MQVCVVNGLQPVVLCRTLCFLNSVGHVVKETLSNLFKVKETGLRHIDIDINGCIEERKTS